MTERETLDRLVDATRMAGDHLQRMCRTVKFGAPVPPRMMVDLVRELRQASGCAHQLGHAQANPVFFDLRDQLEQMAAAAPRMPLHATARLGIILAQMGHVLDELWRGTKAIAVAKPVPRQEVLARLDERERRVIH